MEDQNQGLTLETRTGREKDTAGVPVALLEAEAGRYSATDFHHFLRLVKGIRVS